MLMTPLLKRFSLLFIVLSVILWTAKRENTTDNCTPSVLNPPGHAEEPKGMWVGGWVQWRAPAPDSSTWADSTLEMHHLYCAMFLI